MLAAPSHAVPVLLFEGRARTRLSSRYPHCSSSRPVGQAPPWSA
jgi:hypothetical protein